MICAACFKEFDTPRSVDEGIGAYEYCGQRGVDTRMVDVSPCCDDNFYLSIEDMGTTLNKEIHRLRMQKK
jgi:hypothetical protein